MSEIERILDLAKMAAADPGLRAAMAALPQPTGADFGAPGWEYRDVSWMIEPLWEKLIGVIGAENVKILAGSSKLIQGDRCVRGQMLVSPAGMDNLRTYKPAPKEPV